ncbi:gamma carbonic anhydrase family protein [Clostridium sediminicola]|uniref:gamma carbonic anhydrase family protein n=1 Tax=Clostridium sediminicola TaxID=3114879 RepID=UPI0031F21639
MIVKFKGILPEISKNAFVAESADIIGDVQVLDNANIWYTAVLRGDLDKIVIGEGVNVQDGTVMHSEHGKPTIIHENVTIGHKCIIHCCEIEENCLIGMGSIVLDGAKIGKNTIIGAGSLVTQNKEIPEGVLCLGSPAKVIRKLTDEEIKSIELSAIHYIENSKLYLEEE